MHNYLVSINNLDIYEKLKKVGYTTFLFALKDYSIGYNSFLLSEIENLDSNNYILINRLLDCESITNLKEELKHMKNITGIVFEDIGVLKIVKDLKLDVKLIYFHNHAGTNSKTINFWLNQGIDSVFLSNEITSEEVKLITSNVNKKVVISIFGHNQVMYSRRLLLSNYAIYHDLPKKNIANLKVLDYEFIALENEYGTVFYTNDIYNYTSLLKYPAYLYYLNTSLIKDEEILNVLTLFAQNNNAFNDYKCSGFLEQKTIFKLGERK